MNLYDLTVDIKREFMLIARTLDAIRLISALNPDVPKSNSTTRECALMQVSLPTRFWEYFMPCNMHVSEK